MIPVEIPVVRPVISAGWVPAVPREVRTREAAGLVVIIRARVDEIVVVCDSVGGVGNDRADRVPIHRVSDEGDVPGVGDEEPASASRDVVRSEAHIRPAEHLNGRFGADAREVVPLDQGVVNRGQHDAHLASIQRQAADVHSLAFGQEHFRDRGPVDRDIATVPVADERETIDRVVRTECVRDEMHEVGPMDGDTRPEQMICPHGCVRAAPDGETSRHIGEVVAVDGEVVAEFDEQTGPVLRAKDIVAADLDVLRRGQVQGRARGVADRVVPDRPRPHPGDVEVGLFEFIVGDGDPVDPVDVDVPRRDRGKPVSQERVVRTSAVLVATEKDTCVVPLNDVVLEHNVSRPNDSDPADSRHVCELEVCGLLYPEVVSPHGDVGDRHPSRMLHGEVPEHFTVLDPAVRRVPDGDALVPIGGTDTDVPNDKRPRGIRNEDSMSGRRFDTPSLDHIRIGRCTVPARHSIRGSEVGVVHNRDGSMGRQEGAVWGQAGRYRGRSLNE